MRPVTGLETGHLTFTIADLRSFGRKAGFRPLYAGLWACRGLYTLAPLLTVVPVLHRASVAFAILALRSGLEA